MVAAEKMGGKVLKVCVCNPDLFALDNSQLDVDIGYRIKYMTMREFISPVSTHGYKFEKHYILDIE